MSKKITDSNIMTVGELSKRSGMAVSAIHFYEEKGFIQSWRTEGKQRRFPRGTLRILAIVKAAQGLGFSLTEIKERMSVLPADSAPTLKEWETLASHWKKELNERIKKFISLRDHLDSCIGCGCLSIKDCPLRNSNDKLAKKGPGAHLL